MKDKSFRERKKALEAALLESRKKQNLYERASKMQRKKRQILSPKVMLR
jgi:hypothetical protein